MDEARYYLCGVCGSFVCATRVQKIPDLANDGDFMNLLRNHFQTAGPEHGAQLISSKVIQAGKLLAYEQA